MGEEGCHAYSDSGMQSYRSPPLWGMVDARSVTPPIFSSPSPPPLSPSTSHEDEVEEAMFQTAVKESLDNMNVDW